MEATDWRIKSTKVLSFSLPFYDISIPSSSLKRKLYYMSEISNLLQLLRSYTANDVDLSYKGLGILFRLLNLII